MRPIEIAPSPAALLLSLRGLGYSPETAIADLVDNALTGRARRVRVWLDWRNGDPLVEILDDGRGMSRAGLIEAMRFGGAGPGATRADGDLGRFGLGLKTASLSQCRRLVVATRQGGQVSRLAWDVGRIATGWCAEEPDASPAGTLASAFDDQQTGTLVSWAAMDRLGGLFGLDRDGFNARVADIRAHLAMTFHRFLDGEARRLALEVNGRAIKPWDPFCRWHDATAALPRDVVRGPDGAITARPYILPHRDRFVDEDGYDDAGGPGGWSERQGFYVYRGDRLVSPGGWLGLGGNRAWTREESSRLARIALDLPTSADEAWRIDIRKSMARPPAWARPRLASLGADCRRRAREVFAWRGGGPRTASRSPDPDATPWQTRDPERVPRYSVRREHPAVLAVAAALGESADLVEGLLSSLELTVPVERIWLDVAERGGSEPPSPSADEIDALAGPLATLVSAVDTSGGTEARLDGLMRSLGIVAPALRAAVLARLEGDGA